MHRYCGVEIYGRDIMASTIEMTQDVWIMMGFMSFIFIPNGQWYWTVFCVISCMFMMKERENRRRTQEAMATVEGVGDG